MKITYQGNEYQLVRDWSPDEKLAYRELPHNKIEMLEMFLDEVKLTTVQVGLLKIVLNARESDPAQQEIEAADQQREYVWKMERDIEMEARKLA